MIVYSLARKGMGLGNLVFYAGKVQSINLQSFTPVMTIALVAQNTGNQSYTLKSLAGNLYANDTLVGNVSSFNQVEIGSNSETTLYLTIRMNAIGLVQDIIAAFQGNHFSQKVKLSATANIDNLQVPINLDYTIGL